MKPTNLLDKIFLYGFIFFVGMVWGYIWCFLTINP